MTMSGERPGDEHVHELAADLLLAQLALAVRAGFAFALLGDLVAELADGLLDRGGRDGDVEVVDANGVRRAVDDDVADAGEGAERFVDDEVAVAGRHAEHEQVEARGGHFVADVRDRPLHLRERDLRRVVGDAGLAGA